MEPFQYFPLEPKQNQIRLLFPIVQGLGSPPTPRNFALLDQNVIGVEPDNSLQFELRCVSLYDRPSYTALSYVWGKNENWTDSIIVNGARFFVSPNLYSALRHLQYDDIAPAIWIDAVCINQKDNHERKLQVPKMRSIYSGAKQVIVWLGPTTEDSDMVADFLLQFSISLQKRFKIPPHPKYHLIDYIEFQAESDVEEFINTVIELTPSARSKTSSWLHFLTLFASFIISRPWWFRVWIIQEFATARETFFQIGYRKLGIEELGTLMAIVVELMSEALVSKMRPLMGNSQLGAHVMSFHWILDMHTYREVYHKKGRPQESLYEILCRTYCRPPTPTATELDAGDDRDRVYALLGLVEPKKSDEENQTAEPSRSITNAESDDGSLILDVDYDKPCHEVFVDAAQSVIGDGNFDILALCQHWGEGGVSNPSTVSDLTKLDPSKLPSWAPNWTRSIHLPGAWWKAGQNGHRVLGNGLFSASSSSIAEVSFAVDRCSNGQCHSSSMTLRGLFVDHILETKSTYLRSSAAQPLDVDPLFRKLFKEIRSLCEASGQLGYGTYSASQLQEAAWRMPIWDHEPNLNTDTIQRATSLSEGRYNKLIQTLIDIHRKTPQGEEENLWATVTREVSSDVNVYIGYMSTGSPIRPFITQRGYIGLGPTTMRSGDEVCIFLGARTPHVIRQRTGCCPGYTVLGQAYVHGIMDGELIRDQSRYESLKLY